jgi:hypothetical protein
MRSRAWFLDRLLQFFRLQPCKTAEFKVAFPKTEVLGKPHILACSKISVLNLAYFTGKRSIFKARQVLKTA